MMTTSPLSTLDVREILKSGGEPFSDIMRAVAALAPDQSLRLLATFKPVPLFTVMSQRGFSHTEREIDGGDWEVIFTPVAIAGAAAPAASAAQRGATAGNGSAANRSAALGNGAASSHGGRR